jgi:hypothetical protein
MEFIKVGGWLFGSLLACTLVALAIIPECFRGLRRSLILLPALPPHTAARIVMVLARQFALIRIFLVTHRTQAES